MTASGRRVRAHVVSAFTASCFAASPTEVAVSSSGNAVPAGTPAAGPTSTRTQQYRPFANDGVTQPAPVTSVVMSMPVDRSTYFTPQAPFPARPRSRKLSATFPSL